MASSPPSPGARRTPEPPIAALELHTARGIGPLPECPELAVLENAPLPTDVYTHVDVCDACQLALELLARPGADLCATLEPLMAERADGTLGRAAGHVLDRHLAMCAPCRAVATARGAQAADPDRVMLPRVDPRAYALGFEVARGGMGRILSARDLRVGRPVAIKELLGRSRALAARFEREARVTARLQHPGIVPIYEIGHWPDGTPFYAMRPVDGGTLREAIDAEPTLPARLGLLSAVIAATEAVAFAHARRIIHRDLTPSNVLVGAYGETVVIDWGLAKDLAGPPEPDDEPAAPAAAPGGLTSAGAVMGTAAYMPPEQANGQPVDERADVYALGAILYHVLTGNPPYHGRRTDELLTQLKASPPPALDALVTGAPRDLVSIVAKAMARQPGDRYPSARELAEELKRFQTGRFVEAHAYTATERVRRFGARHRAPLIVTAIAIAALAVVGVIAVRRIVRERVAAEVTVLTLLEERGRNELLAGDSLGALAYLDAAYESGHQDAPSLRFLLASALRDVATVDGHDLDCGSDVREIHFSPDHQAVVAACHDRAKSWRIEDHAELATLGPIRDGFDDLTYSHDGKMIATWGGDGIARLWDASSGRLLHELHHADGSTITFVTFAPDDRRVATSGYDGFARVWDADTGAQLRAIRGTDAAVLRHLFGVLSRDGRRVLTVTIEGEGAGWDVDTGAKLGGFSHGDYVVGGELSPDGTLAVTCGFDRMVKVWDAVTDGTLVRPLAGSTSVVWHCEFSPDGRRILGTAHDGHAFVWDIATGAALAHVMHGSPIWTGHFSSDGNRFVTVGLEGTVKVWDTLAGGLLVAHDAQGGKDARFTPDGQRLVAACGDGRLRVWRNPDGPLRASLAWGAHDSALAVTRDGTRVAVQGADGWVALEDPTSGHVVGTERIAAPVAVSADRVAGVGADGNAVVMGGNDARVLARIAPGDRPRELALSGDGGRLVVVGAGAPEVWDVEDAARIAVLEGASHAVLDDDGRLALAWRDGEPPRVWYIDGGRPGVALAVAGSYRVIGFGDDGRVVVLDAETADARSRTVTVWDTVIGVPVHVMTDSIALPAISARGGAVTTVLASRGVVTWRFGDAIEGAFAGQALQQAELDPSGHLIAGVDSAGEAVLVLDAGDGRLLAKWQIARDRPVVQPDRFEGARASAAWSRDGKSIITRSQRLAIWNADTELPAELVPLVRRSVPWQVENGRLVLAPARLHGRVVRHGQPVANALIDVAYRRPPQLGPEVTWQRNRAQAPVQARHFRSDREGAFAADAVAPGEYALTVYASGATYSAPAMISVEDQELVIDLAAINATTP
jgi:WD40 repeat protein